MKYDASNVSENDNKAIMTLYSCRNWNELLMVHRWIQKSVVSSGLKEDSFNWCIIINNQRGYK